MTKLPAISGRDAVKALRPVRAGVLARKIGYEIDHQTGSHMILRRTTYPFRRLTVPDHRELAKGTLRAIIREAGLAVEQFVGLL